LGWLRLSLLSDWLQLSTSFSLTLLSTSFSLALLSTAFGLALLSTAFGFGYRFLLLSVWPWFLDCLRLSTTFGLALVFGLPTAFYCFWPGPRNCLRLC
jgi:hypothetical protein